MKFRKTNTFYVFLFALFTMPFTNAQNQDVKSNFWEKVQLGGGLGLGFGNNTTNIAVSPSGIYNFNEKVALGLGLQYSYISQKNYYTSHLYGASLIGLVNLIPEIQLSAELEELIVNTTYKNYAFVSENYWNTALFLGAGYRTDNVTIGMRYNVLHNDNNTIYTSAFMPFVRVFF